MAFRKRKLHAVHKISARLNTSLGRGEKSEAWL